MSDQPTLSVTIDKFEARAILESHLLNLGSRIEDYSDRPGLRFLIDVSRKSVTHWKHIIEQLDRIEALDRLDVSRTPDHRAAANRLIAASHGEAAAYSMERTLPFDGNENTGLPLFIKS